MAKSSRSEQSGYATDVQAINRRRQSNVLSCEEISSRLHKKNFQLFRWKDRLDEFLDNPESDLAEIASLTAVIDNLKKDIQLLQSEQRRQGCVIDEPEISYDNQTVISTSSVRRKDARALSVSQFSTGQLG